MSATATTSQTPAAPSAADDIDVTEADVLAALGVDQNPDSSTEGTDPAASEDPAAEAATAAEGETGIEPAATTAEDPAASEATEPSAAAPAVDPVIAALQKQIADLEAKLTAAPAAPAPAASAAPQVAVERPPLSSVAPETFATVTEPGELAAREVTLNKLYAWTLRNEDGGKIGDTDLGRAEVLNLRADVHEALHTAIPQRRQHLAEISRYEGEAVTAYPSLKDPASAESKAVAAFLAENPALKALPQGKLIAADAALGRLHRSKPAAPATAPKPAAAAARPVPPRAPSSPAPAGVLPPRTTPSAASLKSANDRLSKGTGTVDELASVIAASLP